MDNPQNYPLPPGTHAIPTHLIDTRPDPEIDQALLHPPPVMAGHEKNVWFFWHAGFAAMHPYTQRNIRAWHRRLSPSGWVVRVLDRTPGSPLHVARFLDPADPATFPAAFRAGVVAGDHAPQHYSDLIRFPLLLRYGGVYADVGLLQIGDLEALWARTVGCPASPFEVLSYNCGGVEERVLANHFMGARAGNGFFQRCHRLLLALWAAGGGQTSTRRMHASPLLEGAPLMGGDFSLEEDGVTIGPVECARMLTDYIIQGQAMTMVLGLVDKDAGWDGPRYAAEHVYAIEFMVGAQLINELTAWDGRKAFHLMSLATPKAGEEESEEQSQARGIVEACLRRSFGFKLAHGLIVRVLGETLGSLWRRHEGSDDVPGTYAHWLRYGILWWCPDELPPRMDFKVIAPYRVGPLLRERARSLRPHSETASSA